MSMKQEKALGEAIGASVDSIRTWEDGRHNCSFDDLLKIAEHYGITTDYLLGNTPIGDPASAKKITDPLPTEDRIALLRFEEFLRTRAQPPKKKETANR